MRVDRTHYALSEAAERFDCSVGDLLNLATQRKLRLLVSVPDHAEVKVLDATTGTIAAPFLLTPQLLVLQQSAILKIQMAGGTRQSDFPTGFLLKSDGQFVEIRPDYGALHGNPRFLSWRVMMDNTVLLVELTPNKLFVLHSELATLAPSHNTRTPPANASTPEAPSPRQDGEQSAKARAKQEMPPSEAEASPDDRVVHRARDVSKQSDRITRTTDDKSSSQKTHKDAPQSELSTSDTPAIDDAIFDVQTVAKKTGLSRTTVYNKLKPSSKQYDPTFPQRVSLSEHRVGWRRSAVEAWIAAREQPSRPQTEATSKRTGRKVITPKAQ